MYLLNFTPFQSKLLSGQRVISMAYKKHWEVDVCEDMSNFCLLTKNRDVVITAGKYSHKISWEIFAYHFDAEAKGLVSRCVLYVLFPWENSLPMFQACHQSFTVLF